MIANTWIAKTLLIKGHCHSGPLPVQMHCLVTEEQTSLPSIGPDPRIWNGTSAYSFGLNKLVSAILFSLAGGETSRRLLRLMAYAYENVTAD